MPAQSDRVINLRVQATDDGATGTLTKIGKTAEKELNGDAAGGGGGGGLLSQLKGGFGRGSAFTQSLKVLQGGGAILGLTLAGKELGAFAEHATQLRKELADGGKSTGEVVEDLAKGLPILGGWVKAGRELRAAMDGTAADVERLAREDAFGKILDRQADTIRAIQKAREDGEAAARKARNEGALIGLTDPKKSLERLNQERQELEAQASKNRRDITAAVAKEKAADIAELAKRAGGIGDARARLTAAKQQELATRGYGEGNITREQVIKELKDAQSAFLEAASAESALHNARVLQAQETAEKIGAANKQLYQRIGNASKEAGEVERAANQERERAALDHETRMAEIKSKGRQEALKLVGQDVAAEIEAINSSFRVEQAKLFQGFKENMRKSLAGGPDSPLTVGRRFVEELFGRGQLKEQQVGDAVKVGLRKQLLDGARSLSEGISSFSGKDAIDSLLRKMGLKGVKIDRSLPQAVWPGLAEAAQVSQGGSQGFAIAQRLANQFQSNDPAAETQKSAADAAKSAAGAAKSIDSILELLGDFVKTVGVTPAARPG